jgi:hypothetical protein
LYVSEQQYAYGRKIIPKGKEVVGGSGSAIVVLNNDTKPATIDFEVERLGLSEGEDLRDQLDPGNVVQVTRGRRLSVTVPARSAAIFANQ